MSITRRFIVMIIVCIILATLLIGCIDRVIPLAEKPSYIQRWVMDTTCVAPCWEGVRPGLSKISEIDLGKISNDNHLPEYKLVPMWRNNKLDGNFDYWWEIFDKESRQTGTIHLSSTNYIFEILDFSFYEYLTLEDIVLKFGDPETVGVDYVGVEFLYCRTMLFFEDKRIWVDIEENNFLHPHSVNVRPNSRIHVYYVSETIRDKLVNDKFIPFEPKLDYSYYPSEQEQKWDGYKTYKCLPY